jgi:omega-6 fatty acid desaturase (delta-12 desaturase)
MKMTNVVADISKYKASDLRAFGSLIVPLSVGFTGVYLSFHEVYWVYLSGQLLLSLFFLQTFILLHECGHLNFFKSRFLNAFFGNVFGVLSMIPFYTWQHMHHLHHRWTGWRDKDPTTEKTVEPSDSNVMRVVANAAWWLFIPLFYLTYKLSNYWNLLKIKRHLQKKKYSKAAIHVVLYLIIYTALIILFHEFLLVYILPAFLVSLVWKELVIMTQHSHIEIPVSEGSTSNCVRKSSSIHPKFLYQ